MIRRLYVNNFRCLVDFTWEPQAEALILGTNGSGKSAVVEVIQTLRHWIVGDGRLSDLLDGETLARWSESKSIEIDLDVETTEGFYKYQVEFELEKTREVRVLRERLSLDDVSLFDRLPEQVRLQGTVSEYLIPPSLSAFEVANPLGGNPAVLRFLQYFVRMIAVKPIPILIENEAMNPSNDTWTRFEQFVAWYWYQTSNGKFSAAVQSMLKEIWDDFDFLQLRQVGQQTRVLRTHFQAPDKYTGEYSIGFHELSDGERMLIVLYALLAYQEAMPPSVIILDEPDNFVAMSEIQPWLLKMLEGRPEHGQIILISHNPEIIETMGADRVAYFSRQDHQSPTKVGPLPSDDSGLSLSERITRGWIGA
ncbi:MAG: hypothetical protein BGO01_09220 [Armatimonadetes bacterium 55-13]|nr:AAA family ATPase [Armatimonadota bacterium]ODU53943.1 MAG: hypothetical protein ABT09_00720 [bacterium SCN 57-13]OJU62193.1 MAG: hypothetical protein BGO01_09220 [Armatimonadetes bacterium 55-13]